MPEVLITTANAAEHILYFSRLIISDREGNEIKQKKQPVFNHFTKADRVKSRSEVQSFFSNRLCYVYQRLFSVYQKAEFVLNDKILKNQEGRSLYIE
jgi:hypothetical protein